MHATLTAAARRPLHVLALHVHHGLNACANDWVAHCASQCEAWVDQGWPVELIVHRLDARPAPGDSIEAWARSARYRALREMALAHGAEAVLLAHHRRDQAETWLLQALRGAGLAGLASMPASVHRDGLTWLRPWLNRPREQIDAYLAQHALSHIDDDSNDDIRFARNRLRVQVWPALTTAFPQAEASLAASATWAAEAAEALDELAAIDLAACATQTTLHVDVWLTLSPARRSNSLRQWLKHRAGLPAPAALVTRLLAELPACGSGSRWKMANGELRCHRRQLCFATASVAPAQAARETELRVLRAGTHALPGWGGRLRFARVAAGGVPLAWLGRLELKERRGAEQFQAGPACPPRSLKKQFQTANVPAWARHGPLVYSGGQLVYVPGLGLDARAVGQQGQRLMSVQWLPATPG